MFPHCQRSQLPVISLFLEFLQEETSFPSEITQFWVYFALLTSVLGNTSKHKSSSGILSSSTVLQHCPSRCCKLEHSACGAWKMHPESLNTKILYYWAVLISFQVPGILNLHLKIKSRVCLSCPVDFLFPDSKCYWWRSGDQSNTVQGQQSVFVPSPSIHHCHSPRGRVMPQHQRATNPCGVRHEGLGTAFTGVKALQKSCLRGAAMRKKSAATDKMSVFKLNKVMRSTAGGSTGKEGPISLFCSSI